MSKPFLAVIMLIALSAGSLFAQSNVKSSDPVKRKQAFILYAGGGVGEYVNTVPVPPAGSQYNVSRASAIGTFRVMWQPGYRLNLGIETGYTNFYSYQLRNGNKPGKVSVHAIPMLIVWSMPIVKRVNIFAGLGSYLLTSELRYGGVAKSKTFSLGSNIALSYTVPLNKRLGLVTEAKWLNAFVTKDDVLSLQVLLAWKFFR